MNLQVDIDDVLELVFIDLFKLEQKSPENVARQVRVNCAPHHIG